MAKEKSDDVRKDVAGIVKSVEGLSFLKWPLIIITAIIIIKWFGNHDNPLDYSDIIERQRREKIDTFPPEIIQLTTEEVERPITSTVRHIDYNMTVEGVVGQCMFNNDGTWHDFWIGHVTEFPARAITSVKFRIKPEYGPVTATMYFTTTQALKALE